MAKLTGNVAAAYKNRIKRGKIKGEILKEVLESGKLDAQELIRENIITQEQYDALYETVLDTKPEEPIKEPTPPPIPTPIPTPPDITVEDVVEEPNIQVEIPPPPKEPTREERRAAIEDKIRKNLSSDEDIRNYVFEGLFTADELLEKQLISSERKRRLFPEVVKVPFGDWDNVPPLKENRVDVFVLGVASSGKSCFMAGLLHYADSIGRIQHHIENRTGYQYANTLIDAVGRGLVPPPTSVDHIQYMACDLIDDDGDKHPLTFIEMSGEVFEGCHLKTIDEVPVKLKSYFFENPNRKIVFLAIDYGLTFSNDVSQRTQFDFILKFLEENGMIQNLECLVLILTKWDKSPDQSEEAAKDFLQKRYMSLIRLCRDFKEKYGLNYYIYRFSLGKFHHAHSYDYNEADSKRIFELLCQFSPIQQEPKKPGWFNKLFK
ncbi:MAG: hypothetical protein JJT94_08020 [Bernardetiaceae bacterium]|nr:hypothetical protein [Bernardetiaceae bacterium]